MSLHDQVSDLVAHIKAGKILEAFDKHYADNVSMQENRNPPVVGKAANLEREKQFLAQVKEWKRTDITSVATQGTPADGVAFIEYAFDFITTAGQPAHYEQVSVQRWKNGKIASERFYYDTGK